MAWPAPALVQQIALAARAAGGRALVVGGWVRDRLRDAPSKDADVEIYGIAQDRLPALLEPMGRIEPVGHSFPVYKLVSPDDGSVIDVALPRRESKSGRGHKGFVVQGDPMMTVAEAARRRDFTV
jgi:tRNA nucleotidyltransferase (CCA-adding enzyme)